MNLERLESREMLTGNHLAMFEGTVASDQLSDVSLLLDGNVQPVVVSIEIQAANGSSLNPMAPILQDAMGTPLTPMGFSHNSNGQNAIANFTLSSGDFNLFVGGEQNTAGGFVALLSLPGDVSGDGQVSSQEQQAAIAAVVQSQFGFNHVSSQVFSNLGVDVTANLYQPGLDADLNGVVDNFDLDVISANMNQPSIFVEFASDTSSPDIMAAVSGDTGRSDSDGITNNLNMTIDGTIADASPITSFTATVDGAAATDLETFLGEDFSGGGSFSLDLPQLETLAGVSSGALADSGTHTLSLSAQDEEGNASAQPIQVTFSIDTVVPAAPAMPDLDSSSDSGNSSTDNLTNQTVLTIHTDAEDDALVALFSSLVSGSIGDGIVNSPVTIPTDPLPTGTQDITGTATDPAGNTSGPSDPLTVTIDTTPPATPAFDFDAASDTGTLGDGLTTESLVTITGTTEAAASVVLQRSGSTVANGTADGSGMFSFNGVTLPFGASEFTVIASDAAGNSSNATETFTRNDAPVVDDQSLNVDENSGNGASVGTVSASDTNLGEGDSLQFSIIGGNGSTAFAIDGASGAVTVADASQLNFETMPEFTLTVRVTDNGGNGSGTPGTGLSDTAVVTIAVNDANDAPVASDATFNVAENSLVDTVVGTVLVSDPDAADVHTFAITGGNTGGAFAIDTASGEITVANPAALDFESQLPFDLTLTVTDLGGLSDPASVTVNLTDVNEPPTASNATFSVSSSVANGFALGSVNVDDPDVGDSFAFEITDSAPTTSLFVINPTTGTISVPAASGLVPNTSFVLTVQVTDMGGAGFSDSADITINVIPNELPVAVNDDVSTNEDSTLAISVLADNGNGADSDPDGDDALLMVSAFDGTSSSGAAVTLQAGNTLLYDPTGVAAFQALGVGASANDSFTYEISDVNSGTDSATVSITVSGVNDAPTAVNDARTTDEESPITFDPLVDNGSGADSDPDTGDILSVASVDLTSSLGAAITLNGNGTVSYDPRTSATLQGLSAADSPLVDTFTYSINDGNGGSDSATVSVTVSGLDENVTALGEVFQIDQDSSGNIFAVVANDSTSSGGALSVSIASTAVAGATATPSGQNIVYTPAASFLGRDMVTYTVEDAGGGSATAIVTVEVTTGQADLQEHIHADLSVYVNGVRQADPPINIGVETASPIVFTSEVHTHDADGRIHMHPINGAVKTEFSTVGDFFDTWRTNAGLAGNNPDSIFNANQIYDNVADTNHVVRMFVNGLPNTELENYVVENEDEIIITFDTNTDADTPSLLPIDDVDLLSGSPLHLELDGFDLQHDDLTFSATSSNSSLVMPTVLAGNRNMVVTVADFGVMNFELFDGRAPRVTGQISSLVPDYSGVPFHRVIDGFVIQGGDITNGNGTGGSSLGDFDDQFHVDLQHNRSSLLSMAKSSDDTNDSQFFVTEGPTRSLDFNHSIFGVLVEGERVRELISDVATGAGDVPTTPVLMDNVQIITDMENGVLMLESPEGASGEADITVTAMDSGGNMVTWTFHVTVTPDTTDGAPFLGELPATVTAVTGQPAIISVNGGASDLVEDAEGDPFFVDVLERGSIIGFDFSGDDAGVTTGGTTDFSFNGSNWTGGEVVNANSGFNGLFASRSGGYRIGAGGTGSVTFDDPVNSVSFYFTHGQGGILVGTANAFDASDNLIGTASSSDTSAGGVDGDPANFVSFSSGALIKRVEFTAGFVDDFNFRRFTFALNGAMDQITVTPQAGVTGTLPVQLRVRATSPTNTGGGFDADIQNLDIVFGDPLTAEFPGPETGSGAASPSSVATVTLDGQSSTIDELVQSALNVWAEAIDLETTMDVAVEVSDLPDELLAAAVTTDVATSGLPLAGTIILDTDAAGAEWHTDIATLPADAAFDLFTVVLHEVGHLLGFDQALADYQPDNLAASAAEHADADGLHLDALHHPGDLMTASLPLGTRRAPSAFDAQIMRTWYEDLLRPISTAEEHGAVDTVYAALGAA